MHGRTHGQTESTNLRLTCTLILEQTPTNESGSVEFLNSFVSLCQVLFASESFSLSFEICRPGDSATGGQHALKLLGLVFGGLEALDLHPEPPMVVPPVLFPCDCPHVESCVEINSGSQTHVIRHLLVFNVVAAVLPKFKRKHIVRVVLSQELAGAD